MKTINLQGKQYAPVSARVEQLHKDKDDCSITTDTTFSDGYVIIKATVSFGNRIFTGQSYGQTKGQKAFEKLETTAVGRALAFAGYLAGGEIASYDEMEDYVKTTQNASQSLTDALEKLSTATTLEELKTVYTSLTPSLQKDNEVIAKKDELKNRLT